MQDTSQAHTLHSSIIVKTVVRITFPMTGFCAKHEFCCSQSRIEALQLLRLVLTLVSLPHLISCSKWLVIFSPGNDAPGWKSTGKLISRWRNSGECSDWIWSPRANEQCVQHCMHYRHTKEEVRPRRAKAGRVSCGVLASTPAAGKVVWTQDLLGCSNLNLRKLEGKKTKLTKTIWGLEGCLKDMAEAGEYKITAMLADPCPRLTLTPAVLQTYSTGGTCTLLADPDYWHFHWGCHLILCAWMSLILTRSEHRHSRDSKLSSLETWAQDVERGVSVMSSFLTHTLCLSPWTLLSSGLWFLLMWIFYYGDPIAALALSVKHIPSERSGWVKWQVKSKGRAGKMVWLPHAVSHTHPP